MKKHSVSRRLMKTINKINDNFNDNNNNYFISNYNLELYNCFVNSYVFIDNNVINVKIVISFDYPFHPPKILINGIDYRNLLRTPYHFLLLVNNPKCMCCSTILCKWAPIYNLNTCIEEVVTNMKQKKKIIERFHLKKIIDKYLIEDLNYIIEYL